MCFPAGCVCVALPAALRRPQKNTPLKFWSMYLMAFIDLCWFCFDFGIFLQVLGSPSRVCVCCAACGASPTSEKHAPGILEHVPYVFYWCVLIFCWFLYLFVSFRVSQQGVCVLRCLRRFRALRKNTSLEFQSMYLMDFIDFHIFLIDFGIFLPVLGSK